jgi:hypothetical protein
MHTRHLAASLTLALLATLGAAAPAAAATRCADFTIFPDNAPVPEAFKLDKFKFRDRAGGFAPFINVFTDLIGQPVHGLQFDDLGLRVGLPGPTAIVTLHMGHFGPIGPLVIKGVDATGGLQDTLILPGDDIMHTVSLVAVSAPITEVRMVGGGNEGVINYVCATR